ncbi:hypothetical protein BCON_0094g00310 [Botryotinia convoluta]|uniref:Uncharacterized protein n=1 Tax=Botryotinia convoluta TaxID=54673 RepID=A0A4Z1I1D7_9HELO|nr:hypothetical protein BCON_0094g00310 [Botryotinia convoluta]
MIQMSIWDGPSDDSTSVVSNHRPLDAAIDQLCRTNKTLEEYNTALARENASLKNLLATHNTAWPANKNLSTIAASDSSTTRSNPELPLEVKLRIIRFALQLAHQIIDPGVKILKSNVTDMEHAEQKKLPVQLLRLSKFFYKEGQRSLFADNRFIFTQVSSLKWFVSTHPRSCAQLGHLELRIVGNTTTTKVLAKLSHWALTSELNKKLPATFGESEGSEVRFHIASGLPVENVEGDYRILLSRRTEENLDEYEGIIGHHDIDLDEDELTDIYGPIRDGWGPDILTAWDADEYGGPDARICSNCSGMYGDCKTEPETRISLERDGQLGAENEICQGDRRR